MENCGIEMNIFTLYDDNEPMGARGIGYSVNVICV